jgi:hypothetical protein
VQHGEFIYEHLTQLASGGRLYQEPYGNYEECSIGSWKGRKYTFDQADEGLAIIISLVNKDQTQCRYWQASTLRLSEKDVFRKDFEAAARYYLNLNRDW